MRFFVCFILVLIIHGNVFAQLPDSTSNPGNGNFDFTTITTTDFMQGSNGWGDIQWGEVIMLPKLTCTMHLMASLHMFEEGGIINSIKALILLSKWLDCIKSQHNNETNDDPDPTGTPNFPPSSPEETGGGGISPPVSPDGGGGGGTLGGSGSQNIDLPNNWGNGDVLVHNDDNEPLRPQEPTGVFTGQPNPIQLHLDSSLFNQPKDTLKPTRVPCSDTTAASIMAVTLNKVWDSIKNSDAMQVLMEGLHRRRFEVGFRVQENSPGVYTPRGLDTAGTQRNVPLSHTGHTIMFVHSHPEKDSAGIPCEHSPSPADIYALAESWTNQAPPRKLRYLLNVSGDRDTSTFAIAITDSLKLMNFLNNYPAASSVDVLGTNDWKGDKKNTNTLLGKFTSAYGEFTGEKYEEKEIVSYANVYMAQEFDMGITVYKKVNGEFKAMSFKEETDSRNRNRFKITICE